MPEVGGGEVMGRAPSCGETVLMSIYVNNGYELISLIDLCLRLGAMKSWVEPHQVVKLS